MSDADAIVLFRPLRPDALKPFLDLDEESEESDGIYAEALEDGSFLLHTFQPFALFAESPHVAHAWLAQFGEALDEVHDDPRGVLFFPDSIEHDATTYAGVIAEVAEEGVWVSLAAEIAPDDLAALLPPGIDMDALRSLAGQMLGGPQDGSAPAASSFDIAKMFEGMQGQLVETLGRLEALQADAASKGAATPTETEEPPPPSSRPNAPEKKAK